jgi:hypothetical protein
MALSPPGAINPGQYPGSGQASLLRCNEQQVLWNSQSLVAGTTTSIAVQLERLKSSFYPWGAAFEVSFAGAPGSFEIDIQFAEVDKDANYVTVGTITAVNSSNVGRYDMPNTVYPKFVRGFCKTLTNPVTASLLVTR